MSPAAWVVVSPASPIKPSILTISAISTSISWLSCRFPMIYNIWRSVAIIWLVIQCSLSVLLGLPPLLFELFLVKAPLLAQLCPIFNAVGRVAHILLDGQIGEVDWADGLWGHITAWPVRMGTKDYLRFVLFSLVFANVGIGATTAAWRTRSRTWSATAML